MWGVIFFFFGGGGGGGGGGDWLGMGARLSNFILQRIQIKKIFLGEGIGVGG